MLGTLTLYSQVRPPRPQVAHLGRGVSSYPLVSGPGAGSPLSREPPKRPSSTPRAMGWALALDFGADVMCSATYTLYGDGCSSDLDRTSAGGLERDAAWYMRPPVTAAPGPSRTTTCDQSVRAVPSGSLFKGKRPPFAAQMPASSQCPADTERWHPSRHGQPFQRNLDDPRPLQPCRKTRPRRLRVSVEVVCGSSRPDTPPQPARLPLRTTGSGMAETVKSPPSAGATALGLGQSLGSRRRPPHSTLWHVAESATSRR